MWTPSPRFREFIIGTPAPVKRASITADTSCMTARDLRGPPIPVLIPDMPSAQDVLPWLERIDQTRWYTNGGSLVAELERELVDLVGHRFSVEGLHGAAVSTGTAALELGLSAMGIGADSQVMLPALTFPATATAVRRVGAREVLVDVDPDSWSLTPEIATAALRSARVDLVVPVAAFGRPQDVHAWDTFAERTGVPVLIDAAAAFGSQPVGRHTAVAFSLHATKPFGVGEGGLLVSTSAELIERVRRLSNFGFHEGVAQSAGSNSKLSEYHGAVGLAQFHRFAEVEARRRRVWAWYRSRLERSWNSVALQQQDADYVRSVVVVKSLTPGGATTLEHRMAKSNVETRRWYHPPLYEQPAFSDAQRVGPDGGNHLPETAELAERLVGLPFHSFLCEFDITRISSLLHHEAPLHQDAPVPVGAGVHEGVA